MVPALGSPARSLFGRHAESDCLRALLAAAAEGNPQVAVISGELGVGKTALVGDVVSSTDMRTLAGHCLPVEGEAMPFAPITASLRDLFRDLPADETADVVRQWPRAFVDFLPFECLDHDLDEPPEPDEAPLSSTGQSRLFEWLLTLLVQLSRQRPIGWLIEDVQWADTSTRDLVSFLARNLQSEPVAIILTLRTDELDRDHPVKRWLVELDRTARVTRVPLQRLSREATRGQLSHLMSETEFVRRATLTDLIYEHSQGNPLFTEQLVSWAQDGRERWPDSLYELVASRLATLPSSTRSVLDAAAVVGRTFALELLAAVLERDARAIELDLQPAVERDLISPHPASDFSFAKPLIREVLEADLLPGQRRRLHEAAARGKSSQVAHGADAHFGLVGEIAHHWAAAQVPDKAFAAAVEAGLSAERLYALAEADRYFGKAVVMPCSADPAAYDDLTLDRLDLLLHAAQAAHLVGDGTRAMSLIDQAGALADDPVRKAAVLERKGAFGFNAGRVDEAHEAYTSALVLLPDEPSVLRAQVLGGLGLLTMAWSRMDEAEATCHEALRIARAVGARQAEVRALNALGVLTTYRGRFDEGIGYSREAVVIAEELDAADDLATAYIDLAHVLGVAGRYDEAVEASRIGYDAMSRVGLARQDGSFLQANAAESLIKAGRWDEAAELLARARKSETRGIRAFPVLEHEARLRLRMGDFDRAQDCVDEARALFDEFDAPDAWRREYHEVAAELMVYQRRSDEALAEANQGLAMIEGTDEERFAGLLILTAAQATADLLDEARTRHDTAKTGDLMREVQSLRARAEAMEAAASAGGDRPLPEAQAVAKTIDAELLRAAAAESTAATWAEVAQQWETLGQPFPAAYARWREAECLVMSKRVGQEPVAAVRRAHEAATRLGAQFLVAEVENLARWGRIDVRPDAADLTAGTASTDLGLTQREQEVLAGLLAGQTNREIAESLFISVKTTSVHVSNILRKLGVHSREEAARVAYRHISET